MGDGWPHRVAAGLLVLIGGGFVAVTLAANLFQVGPAFDRLTDDFRPVMTERALQTDRADIAALAAADTEIKNEMVPALAQQLGMTPEQFSTMMAEQYPDVNAGLAAVPQITPSFTSLVDTLDSSGRTSRPPTRSRPPRSPRPRCRGRCSRSAC